MSLLVAIAVLAGATTTASGAGQDPKAPVRVVGTYSTIRYTDDGVRHAVHCRSVAVAPSQTVAVRGSAACSCSTAARIRPSAATS